MPRIVKIKWRSQDINLLRKTVKNFNAKINRIVKKNPLTSEYLPQKVSVKELRKMIETRQDFNATIKSLQRFSKKGAEKPITNKQGLTITAWEKQEIAIKLGIINRRRAAERKRRDIKPTKGNMLSEAEFNLAPKPFNWESKKKSDWEMFKESVHNQSKATYLEKKIQQYFDNYMKAIDNQLGAYGAIVKALAQKAGKQFIYDIYSDETNLQIDFIYGAEERYARIGKMIQVFEKYGYELDETDKERFRDMLSVVGAYMLNPPKQNGPYDEPYIDVDDDDDFEDMW